MIDIAQLPTIPGKLTRIHVSPPVRVSYRRSPPSALLFPSGRAIFNLAATESLHDLARTLNQAPGKHTILPAVNEESGVVAFYIVELGTIGSIVAKAIDKGKRTSLNLSGVFTLYPALQANLLRTCPVNLMKDEDGEPCLVMAIKGSAIKTPSRRPAKAKALDAAMVVP